MRFFTFFPACVNADLTKDVGMIPFVLHRDFAYDSYLVCYRNGDYPRLETDVPGLKLLFMDRNVPRLLRRIIERLVITNPILAAMLQLPLTVLDSLPTFLARRRQIEVLHLMHLKAESLVVGLIYRLLNRKGIVYMKLDVQAEFMKSRGSKISRLLSVATYVPFKVISPALISIETKALYDFARTRHPLLRRFADRVTHLPNGVDAAKLRPLVWGFRDKDDIVLHAARMGSYQKASEIVLQAFASVHSDFPDWKLVLIGAMTSDFGSYLRGVLESDRDLERKVCCVGYIDGPVATLYRHYARAKVLMFPSRFEGFALVPLEAGFFGDVLLASDIPSTRDVTKNGSLACLCPIDDVRCFTEGLRYLLSHRDYLEEKSRSITEFVEENFDWRKICGVLHERLLSERATV